MEWTIKSPYKRTLLCTLAGCFLTLSSMGAEYFSLPVGTGKLQVPNANLTYSGKSYRLSGKEGKISAPQFEGQAYLFEKQTFLTARRDQAIKLLRQELNSGYRKNRDNVLLRLGQLYTEKYMELNFHEVELFTQQHKAWAVAKKGKEPRISNKRSHRYLGQALGMLNQLEKEFPRHHRMDEIVYFLGFVHMEMGQSAKGAKYLERLTREYPRSPKVQEANLSLADYYFDQQQFDGAIKRYRTLLNDESSETYYYALYKLSWCQLNLNEVDKGLRNMKLIISKLEGDNGKLRFNIREQAINDIAFFFVETEKAEEAFDYYVKILGKEKAADKLQTIALTLHSRGKSQESLKAYERLLEMDPNSPNAAKYAISVYEARSRLGQNKEAVASLLRLLEKYGPNSAWAKKFEGEQAKLAQERIEEIQKDATNAAYFYHQTAQKSKNKAFFDYALQIYSGIERHFPSHPDKRQIIFYQGEILYKEGKYLAAADKYMVVARDGKKDKLAEEAAYNALLAVDQLTSSAKVQRFTEKEKKEKTFEKVALSEGEKRFIEVSEFYLKEYSKFDRATDVRFRIGGIYYRGHHFDEAAVIFKEIATNQPKHKSAETSAHLLLDIYNIRKDYAALTTQASIFAKTPGLGGAEFKAEMARFRDEIGFKAIESYEANNEWSKAGEAYLKYYEASPKGALAEKSLYNAVISYEKSGDNKAIQNVSKIFMKAFPKHQYSKRLVLVNAKSAELTYDYDAAQAGYEKFYRDFPKDAEANKALYNSAVFADLLDKNDKAISLYTEYLQKGKVPAKEARGIRMSQAQVYAKMRNWKKAGELYAELERTAPTLNDRITVLGKMAELYQKSGRTKDRAETLEKVRGATLKLASAKQFGPDSYYVGEARMEGLKKDWQDYERVKLQFPPQTLVSGMKRKQDLLKRLEDKYGAIVELGNPHWGVAALSKMGDGYSHFVTSFKNVSIPASYKGEQRKEIEGQLAILEKQFIAPFEKKVVEIYHLCASKAMEFHVASAEAQKCQVSAGQGKDNVPSGVLPKPAYWTTRWGGSGVAQK